MRKYIDAGTARQHLTDRLMESALNNVGIKADVDEVFRDIAENRLPVWIAELKTYDVQEVRHGRWNNGFCSVCGAEALTEWNDTGGEYAFTTFCPNCGARMEE